MADTRCLCASAALLFLLVVSSFAASPLASVPSKATEASPSFVDSPAPRPSSPRSDDPCGSLTTCGDCTVWNCVWCQDSSQCLPGSFLGPKDSSMCDSGDWRYMQCLARGLYVELAILGAAIIVILLIIIIISCCCCCKKKDEESGHNIQSPKSQRRGESRRLLDDVDEEDVENRPSLHPKNDQKRLQLSEKYGVDFGAARVRSFNGMNATASETNPFK